jgi:hypothetical protein
MHPECISKPTKEQWELTAVEFVKKKELISCIAQGAAMGNIFE